MKGPTDFFLAILMSILHNRGEVNPMNSLFSCPLCAAPLERTDTGLQCPGRHSFDRAAAGYVHLLPPNRKHSQNPGDDKEMVAARSAFLDKGYYSPLRDALCELALDCLKGESAPVVVDSGCGEGYYTAGLYETLSRAGKTPKIAGVDISKFALRRAARRLKEGEFAVASVYRLPLPDESAHLLVNVFSPLAPEEFARVLRPGGHFLYAVPSKRHLWEMKKVLYEKPYENPVKREDYTGFAWERVREARYEATLESAQDIMALFHMTPYAWKTPRAGVERLEKLERLKVQIGFDFHVYRRL